MKRRFVTLDVFTNRRMAGNPLAVVLDAENMNTAEMQLIAREFNLSETVFLLPPQDPHHRANLRIFTPRTELPFAGHPTIGTAIVLALHDQAGKPGARSFGVETAAGVIPCVADIIRPGHGRARFRAPALPFFQGEGPAIEDVAQALGLEPHDIGFGHHMPSRHGVKGAFDCIPIATREALNRIKPELQKFDDVFGRSEHQAVYAYTNEPLDAGHHFHTRMFAPALGIPEDPATGSAAVAFAGVLMQFEPMGDGTHDFVIEQGYAMDRPSQIKLQLHIESGELSFVEIGGEAIVVSNGNLRV